MRANHHLLQITGEGANSATHAGFDSCPESPNGQWVTYFAFDGARPGTGAVMIRSRDGGKEHALGVALWGANNEGARQMWVGDAAVAYQVLGERGPRTVIAPLNGGPGHSLARPLSSFSAASGLGLAHSLHPKGLEDDIEAIYLVDIATGESQAVIALDAVLAVHPLRRKRGRSAALETAGLRLTKPEWAADGKRFFFVLTNAPDGPQPKGQPLVRSLFLAEAEGRGLSYLGEFGRNPIWGPGGGYIYTLDRWPDGSHTLFARPTDGSAPYPLLPRVLGTHASLSPDAQRVVVDILDRPDWGQASLWLYNVADGSHEVLAEFDAPDLSLATGVQPRPAWSRDGQRVYFTAGEDNVARLFAISVPQSFEGETT